MYTSITYIFTILYHQRPVSLINNLLDNFIGSKVKYILSTYEILCYNNIIISYAVRPRYIIIVWSDCSDACPYIYILCCTCGRRIYYTSPADWTSPHFLMEFRFITIKLHATPPEYVSPPPHRIDEHNIR